MSNDDKNDADNDDDDVDDGIYCKRSVLLITSNLQSITNKSGRVTDILRVNS